MIRFQQTTPPVFAKGVEDTAFYRYNRLLCLNEVGGDPGRFSLARRRVPRREPRAGPALPAASCSRPRRTTRSAAATSVRGSPRSPGSPTNGASTCSSGASVNEPLRTGGAPDADEEYLIYQTLVGAWPLEPERLEQYLEKALREAKSNTNWIEPNARLGAVRRRRSPAGSTSTRRSWTSFEPFAERVAARRRADRARADAAQAHLPGVPDIYQGDELWSLNLVDPDNRRPVDWEHAPRAARRS